MSFNEPRHFASSFSTMTGSKNKKGSRRTVRLELPPGADLLRTSSQEVQNEGQPGSFTGQTDQEQNKRAHSLILKQSANLSLPSIFYEFSQNTVPVFTKDVLTPDVSFPFIASPPIHLVNPHFMIYAISSSVSTSPVKVSINSTIVNMRFSNSTPVDATDLLAPFSQQNWLVIETGSLVVPFTICGVWVSTLTLSDVIAKIAAKGVFTYNDLSAICPLSGKPIVCPVKGQNCMHEQCFDLVPFIGFSMALGEWVCPICHIPLPIDELILGQQPEFNLNTNIDESNDQLEVEGDGFWDF